MAKNIESFFDADRRDTFEISDILKTIGFLPTVNLEIIPGKGDVSQLRDTSLDSNEVEAISSALEFMKGQRRSSFDLSESPDSFLRSLRGQNRLILKNIGVLRALRIVKSYSLVFQHAQRRPQRFAELSSGEQTMISTFLFIKSNSRWLERLFIDEPENSLHPDWQRRYLEIIHMALGYHDVKIFLATHSPVIVSGALSSYGDAVEIRRITGDESEIVEIKGLSGPDSVEEILWKAFDTITPVSHFLSIELSQILQNMADGRIKKSEAVDQVRLFQSRSYNSDQQKLLEAIIDKIAEFKPNAPAND